MKFLIFFIFLGITILGKPFSEASVTFVPGTKLKYACQRTSEKGDTKSYYSTVHILKEIGNSIYFSHEQEGNTDIKKTDKRFAYYPLSDVIATKRGGGLRFESPEKSFFNKDWYSDKPQKWYGKFNVFQPQKKVKNSTRKLLMTTSTTTSKPAYFPKTKVIVVNIVYRMASGGAQKISLYYSKDYKAMMYLSWFSGREISCHLKTIEKFDLKSYLNKVIDVLFQGDIVKTNDIIKILKSK